MRRFIGIFGIALMIIAFVILTIFIIAPSIVSLDDAPLLRGMMQMAVCRSDEVLTAGYSTYRTPGTSTTSINYHCVDGQQNARDVNQQIVQIGAFGYLVPFLIGLFTFLLNRSSGKKQGNLRPGSVASDIAALNSSIKEQEAIHKARMKSRSGGSSSNPTGPVHSQAHGHSDHLPLAQRLEELKEAFNAGLMTEGEYEARRKELLNKN